MDPRLNDMGNILLPFIFGLVCSVFAWVQADLGVTHVWFKSIYRDDYPRAYWILGEGAARLVALVCFLWGAANLWFLFVVPGLGGVLAEIVQCVLALLLGTLVIAADFRSGYVWITFRCGWPSPVWRDQSPVWFWFWEVLQAILLSLLAAYALPRLFSDVGQLM